MDLVAIKYAPRVVCIVCLIASVDQVYTAAIVLVVNRVWDRCSDISDCALNQLSCGLFGQFENRCA